MKSPKVSIIIPTYQQVDYLQKLLDSIQRQHFDDYEVIVHDDSPSDSVQQLVANYPLDGRLYYFHNQPALGSPVNWNVAIRRSQGEYIKVMMHDDWFLDETCLGKFVKLLDNNPKANFGFAVQKTWFIQDNKYVTDPLTPTQKEKLVRFPEWLFFGNHIGVPSTTIFRRQLNQFYDPKLKYLVDLEFSLRAIRSDHCFAYHPEPLVCVPVGLDFQVTNDCKGNKSVELFEHAHMFNTISYKWLDPRFFYHWMKLFQRFRVDRHDPDYHHICRSYPSIANYLALAQRSSILVQPILRLKQIFRNYLIQRN